MRAALAILLGTVLLLGTALLAGGAFAQGLDLPGLGGGRLNDAELEQGTVIVVVWASWSPRCRDIVPRLQGLSRRWSGSARVVSVVFQEEAGAVRTFLRGQELGVPVYLDSAGSFSKEHAVTTLPGLLVFKDGQNLYRGKLPDDPDPLIERTLE